MALMAMRMSLDFLTKGKGLGSGQQRNEKSETIGSHKN